jgi:hypothetical protein
MAALAHGFIVSYLLLVPMLLMVPLVCPCRLDLPPHFTALRATLRKTTQEASEKE